MPLTFTFDFCCCKPNYPIFTGFVFGMYEGRRGEILSLDCVTDTATLTKFTHKNLQGIQRDYYYSTTPTILHNYKYLLHKQRYSKLLHVYSMIITKLDYSDEGEYYCHLSDGRMSYSSVYVLGTSSKYDIVLEVGSVLMSYYYTTTEH